MVSCMINLVIHPAEPTDLPSILERFLRYAGSAILIGLDGDELVASCTVIVIPYT